MTLLDAHWWFIARAKGLDRPGYPLGAYLCDVVAGWCAKLHRGLL